MSDIKLCHHCQDKVDRHNQDSLDKHNDYIRWLSKHWELQENLSKPFGALRIQGLERVF